MGPVLGVFKDGKSSLPCPQLLTALITHWVSADPVRCVVGAGGNPPRHASILLLAYSIDRNLLAFRHSSRSLLLNDSMNPFSVDFPGGMKSSVTPASIGAVIERSGGELSAVIDGDYPRLAVLRNRPI